MMARWMLCGSLGAPDATAVHSLLRNPNVRLMSFPTAEAYTMYFPRTRSAGIAARRDRY